jgi:hypothetical protein
MVEVASIILFAAARPAGVFWGVLVPGTIFAASFAITWALYRRFARDPGRNPSRGDR